MSVQRLLANANNALINATLSASSTAPALASIFREPQARTGNGEVILSGGYSGAADAAIEIEIRTPVSGAESATTPVFAGAGNGAMSAPTVAPGTPNQDLTVTLINLGTATTRAQAILYAGVLLQAKTAGSAGNAITINVTPSIALDTAIGALADGLSRDTQEWADQRLDFGAVPLNPDQTVPDTATRLVFGRDTSRVYRHYKRWDGEQWQYGVSPKLAAAYPKGADVHTISGAYQLTVTNGATTETWGSLITLYDLLRALESSSLVTVATPPANDKTPGGMAAIDVPFRTAAFALPITKSRPALPDLVGLAVAATAPTETVALECLNDQPIGAETWAVQSKVAGALPPATTAILYTDSGFVGFTIPLIPLVSRPVSGRISITDRSFPRDAGDTTGTPAICLYRPILGVAATNKTLKLIWTKRPAGDCSCTEGAVSGRPNEDYLGIDLGDLDMAALQAGHRARLEALTRWYKAFAAANTEKTTAGEVRSAQQDLQLAALACGELNTCLTDLYGCTDAILADPVWGASAAYSLDAVVESTTRNGYRYRCTVAGQSGTTQPTWPTTLDATVTDGTVTWTCVSKTATGAWDDVLAGLSSDLSSLQAIGAATIAGIPVLAASTAYALGAVVWYRTTGGATLYGRCVVAGTTGTSGIGLVGGVGELSGGGGSVPTWLIISRDEAWTSVTGEAADINVTDGRADDPGIVYDPDTFVLRYAIACDAVRAIAGVPPKKSEARSSGNAIWQDLQTDYWVVSGEDYLPLFNNVYYHACVRQTDADGTVRLVPTLEFGFAVRVGCASRLKYGDSLTVTLGDVEVTKPYAKGDRYEIPVVRGAPLAFAGGVDGNDTLTWKVESSLGPLPDYALTAAEPAYSASGIDFTLHRGGLPFALRDAFRFSVEVGGRFRWRKDSGSWSSDTALAASVPLADGLSAAFVPGAAPSFVSGDRYLFSVRQGHGVAAVRSPHGEQWRWSGSDAVLTITWPTAQTISLVGLLRHGLMAPATVTLTFYDATASVLATLTPTISDGPLIMPLLAPLTTVRTLTLTLSNAAGMSLGWLYAGDPFAPLYNAALTLRRDYAMARSEGTNPRAAYLGSGFSGELRWENNLRRAEWATLLHLMDDCKQADDAPIVLIPHISQPDLAALARIDADTLAIRDVFDWQPTDPEAGRLSLTLPLTAVLT